MGDFQEDSVLGPGMGLPTIFDSLAVVRGRVRLPSIVSGLQSEGVRRCPKVSWKCCPRLHVLQSDGSVRCRGSCASHHIWGRRGTGSSFEVLPCEDHAWDSACRRTAQWYFPADGPLLASKDTPRWSVTVASNRQ